MKNWEEDFKLENGNYNNTCTFCKEEFIGYKRRVVCKECFDKIKNGFKDETNDFTRQKSN